MGPRTLIAAIFFAVISYLVVQNELWDRKWLIMGPLFLHKHLFLRFLKPLQPSTPVLWMPPSSRAIQSPNPPNIILIITDDLGINDLSGGCGVHTPNIDSVRNNGVSFTQAYAAHATCAPSRAAMLTGRFPTRYGFEFTPAPKAFSRILTLPTKGAELLPAVFHKDLIDKLPPVANMSLPVNETLISEILQQRGYDTYYIGKWDAGTEAPNTPIDRGYNESLAFYVGASFYQSEGHPDVIDAYGARLDQFLRLACRFSVTHNNQPPMEPDKYMTDYLSEQASNLIRSRKGASGNGQTHNNEPSPFFLTLAYNAPHIPYQAMRWDYEDPEVQKLPTHMERVYAAMIKALDRGVGTVLDALRETGQYDNTIVIFTNDNGGAHYANLPQLNAPYRGWKATFFEGGVRVPMLVQWPARIKPLQGSAAAANANRSAHLGVDCGYRVVEDVVSHVDLFTTLASVAPPPAGLPAAAPKLDGLNLFDLVRAQGGWIGGEEEEGAEASESSSQLTERSVQHSRHRVLYWRSGHYSAVRVGPWKLQIALRPDKVWFYDLHADPTERRNLAAEVGLANRRALEALRDKHAVQEASGDVADRDGRVLSGLLEAFAALEEIDAEQAAASWPAASESVVRIDKVLAEPQELTDDHVYWSN